jgi:hypothetical protein
MMLSAVSYRDVLRLVGQSSNAVRSSSSAEDAYRETRQWADVAERMSRLEEDQL